MTGRTSNNTCSGRYSLVDSHLNQTLLPREKQVMIKSISVASVMAILGSLILPMPVSAQSGTQVTFGDSPPQAWQAPQAVAEAPVGTSLIVQAPVQPEIGHLSQVEMSVPTAECNRCKAGEPAKKKCGCSLCRKKKNGKPSPCAGSHKTLFYANDFSYLSDKDNTASCLGDNLKDRKVGKHGTLSLGGQIRWRYHSERGLGQQAGFTRFQADVLRGNDEYIERAIDSNRGDFLNLFADFNLDDRTTVRLGRQELLFGNQRLISPLDWSNTRRRFDGVRTISKFDKFKLDTFYTQFVPVQPTDFDTPNEDLHFWGAYATLTELENKTLDLYYIGLNNNAGPDGFEAVHTFGSRLQGSTANKLLYEFEGSARFDRRRRIPVCRA